MDKELKEQMNEDNDDIESYSEPWYHSDLASYSEPWYHSDLASSVGFGILIFLTFVGYGLMTFLYNL